MGFVFALKSLPIVDAKKAVYDLNIETRVLE